MDHMDIDQVADVPDSPDRSSTWNINERTAIVDLSVSASHRSQRGHIFDGDTRYQRHVNRNGNRTLVIRPPKRVSGELQIHGNSTGSSNSSSSRNPLLFRRLGENTSNNERKPFEHRRKKENPSAGLQLSACKDTPVPDLTEKTEHVHWLDKDFQCASSGSSRPEELRNPSASAKERSSDGTGSSSMTSRDATKGKSVLYKVGSSSNCAERNDSVGDVQPKASKNVAACLAGPPRVLGQKRLVRNGCISPQNIAKARQSVGKDLNGAAAVVQCGNHSIAVEQNNSVRVASDSTSSHAVRDLISDCHDSHSLKGKGLAFQPSSEEIDTNTKHACNRNSGTNEKVETNDEGRDTFRNFQELGGWRSTRNRSQKVNFPMPHRDRHPSIRESSASSNSDNRNKVGRRETGRSVQFDNDYPEFLGSSSFESATTPRSRQTVPHIRVQSSQSNGHFPGAHLLNKRKSQLSSSSNHGECSTSAFNESDVLFLGASESTTNLRSTGNQDYNTADIRGSVIEIDDCSPVMRHAGIEAVDWSNNDEDARARQLEADEKLARELQEQLYNEMPVVGVDENDADLALALEQDALNIAFTGERHHVINPRISLMANSYRPSTLRSSLNIPRRVPQSRSSTSNRISRLRHRFPGQPRTLSSPRGRNSLFPPSMDVDMRMHILETLEAFNDMGVGPSFMQIQRDFNENDYEMLLALDENNHQHGGASVGQINSLPQSTVQSESFEEACAVCLETPTVGDIIRHLPCLHKFHKDCIDPWLRRKTSCPICKSSIT